MTTSRQELGVRVVFQTRGTTLLRSSFRRRLSVWARCPQGGQRLLVAARHPYHKFHSEWPFNAISDTAFINDIPILRLDSHISVFRLSRQFCGRHLIKHFFRRQERYQWSKGDKLSILIINTAGCVFHGTSKIASLITRRLRFQVSLSQAGRPVLSSSAFKSWNQEGDPRKDNTIH